ncbi:MAG: hypothetical protein J0L58_11170 [Burkholderiales bacterium]|nr:hypothetical protein [Burkholderiales bacterium]
MQVKSAVALATTAAALFATALPTAALADNHGAKVKCSGVHSCKGNSDCKAATHACKGQNACKGQGWVYKKSAEECKKDGGKVVDGK